MIPIRDLLSRWPTVLRLPLRFDAARLADDLARIDPAWWSVHRGPYHDGAWEAVALWAPRGDLREQTSRGGAFAATEALRRCDYVPEVLAAFRAEANRVRLMRLRAGGRILRHSDPMHQIAPNVVRVHVPIVTNDDVSFLVNGRRVAMQPGEAWIVDVRFPHEVHNGGSTDRVHLVADLHRNAALDALARDAECLERAPLTGYFLRHALPARVRRWAGIGN